VINQAIHVPRDNPARSLNEHISFLIKTLEAYQIAGLFLFGDKSVVLLAEISADTEEISGSPIKKRKISTSHKNRRLIIDD